MTEVDTTQVLLQRVAAAVESDDSAALLESASELENVLEGCGNETVCKAAHVLKIMGRVRDTANTRKVFDLLKREITPML